MPRSRLPFVLSLPLAMLATVASARAEPVVTAVWRSGSAATEVRMGQNASSFTAYANVRHKQGLRLVDVETYVEGGTRRFAGLWRPGADRNYHNLALTQSALNELATTRHKDKLRLVDVETYVDGGQRKWAAVWRRGTHRQYYELEIDESQLAARLAARHKDKLRVIDIETYVQGGKRKWAVVWSAGTYRNHVSVGLDKAALAALATERHADGLRLVDLERYVAGGKELWAGVWRAGGDANYYAVDRYPETFDELHAYRADTGLELSDLEVYDRACGDVFLLPFENAGKWRVRNGNWDEGGHGGKVDGLQAFAWDFINDTNGDGKADEGGKVLAARGGVVVDMQANETGNTAEAWKSFKWSSGNPPPSVGNFVVVDHHDGTYGTYWHLLAGSVPVAVGDAVVTGQVLGRVGNTGNSSTPHLHFDVRVDWELDYPMPKFKEYRSIRVRMRDKNHACWIPRKADTLASDNTVTLPPMTAASRRVPAAGSRAPQPSPRGVPRPKLNSRGDAQPSRERPVERATPPG